MVYRGSLDLFHLAGLKFYTYSTATSISSSVHREVSTGSVETETKVELSKSEKSHPQIIQHQAYNLLTPNTPPRSHQLSF